MIAAGFVTGWFVAKDAPIFGVAQVMMTLVLVALIVAVVALRPQGWTTALTRFHRPR
ncbi:hypothetical protein IC232_09250 [Microvirga sp. BT688]|uniref:hypothetical protein n=1 Tax=Microvirga sp. TaxID=1873136 RepID=UPI001684BA33|nr:hypothetical protein [Microvirga sp.]MBD2746879.1 hypothetical protein [Microvirga sp.]